MHKVFFFFFKKKKRNQRERIAGGVRSVFFNTRSLLAVSSPACSHNACRVCAHLACAFSSLSTSPANNVPAAVVVFLLDATQILLLVLVRHLCLLQSHRTLNGRDGLITRIFGQSPRHQQVSLSTCEPCVLAAHQTCDPSQIHFFLKKKSHDQPNGNPERSHGSCMTIRILWLVTPRRKTDLLHSFVNSRIRLCLSETSKDNLVRLRHSASGTIANGVTDRAAFQEGKARSQARKLTRQRVVDGGFFFGTQ